MIRVFNIGDLERTTGIPRTAIHYYLRRGLLPRPQKTAASRSLYSQEHVEILERIAELKREGRSLAEIESELQPRLDQANEVTVDLVAQEHERMHNRILALAADEFAIKGYKNTHVTTIMRKLGITATLFYTHFPSKMALLAECVTILMGWSSTYIDDREAGSQDPGERLLWNIFANSRVFDLGSTALAVMRVESTEDGADLQRSISEGFDATAARILEDLDRQRDTSSKPSPIPGELLALNLFGAYDHAALRSRLDKHYSRRDLLRAYLWLFLAAQAGRNGEVDIDSRLARYEKLIARLSSEMPPLPPELELKPNPCGT